LSQSSLTSSQKSRVSIIEPDHSFERYMVDEFKEKASTSKEVPFETIDINLYSSNAKIVAFKTSEQRLRYWIEASQLRYVDYLDKQEAYRVTWEETESISQPGRSDKITISVNNTKKKLFALNIFITTGRLQIRGPTYKDWARSEFPLFMQIIKKLINSESTTTECEQDLFYYGGEIDQVDNSEGESSNESSSSDSDSEVELQQTNKDKCLSLLADNVSTLELKLTQTTLKLEDQIKSIRTSLEETLFIKDRIVRCENNHKANQTNLDDKLHSYDSRLEHTNKQITELSTQVKKLHDQRIALLNKQTEMNNTITTLTNENNKLKQELFILKEITQKHENALETPMNQSQDPLQDLPSPKPTRMEQDNFIQTSNSTSIASATSSATTTDKLSSQSSKRSPPTLTTATSDQTSATNTRLIDKTSQITNNSTVLLIDSNGKFIDPKLLCPDNPVIIKHTYKLNQIKETIDEISTNPTTIVIHCGTNDLEKSPIESVTNESKNVLESTKKRFPNTHIIYSSLLPRQDQLQHQVTLVNHDMYNYCTSNNITFVTHDHIRNSFQFNDNKHLNRHGQKFFAKNLKSAIFNTPTKESRSKPLNLIRRFQHNMKQPTTSLPPQQHMNKISHLPQFPRSIPPTLPAQHHNSKQQQFHLQQERPSYAEAVSSRLSPRLPTTDPQLCTGLPTPLRTLIRQLQMFL